MNKIDFSGLKTMYVNCTLKRSPEKSHTQGLLDLSVGIMKNEGVQLDQIRLADQNHSLVMMKCFQNTELQSAEKM